MRKSSLEIAILRQSFRIVKLRSGKIGIEFESGRQFRQSFFQTVVALQSKSEVGVGLGRIRRKRDELPVIVDRCAANALWNS